MYTFLETAKAYLAATHVKQTNTAEEVQTTLNDFFRALGEFQIVPTTEVNPEILNADPENPEPENCIVVIPDVNPIIYFTAAKNEIQRIIDSGCAEPVKASCENLIAKLDCAILALEEQE